MAVKKTRWEKEREAQRPLRFFEAGSRFVSGPRKLVAGGGRMGPGRRRKPA